MKTLKDVWIDAFSGKTPAKKDYITEEDIDSVDNDLKTPILKVKTLTNDSINWNNVDWILYNSDNKTVQENDLLLTSSAHQVDYIAKKVDIIRFDELPDALKQYKTKCTLVGEVMLIRPNLDEINTDYLLYFLRTPYSYLQIKRCITGQSAHLYPEDIADNVLILIPPDKGDSFAKEIIKSTTEIHKQRKIISEIKAELSDKFENLIGIKKQLKK